MTKDTIIRITKKLVAQRQLLKATSFDGFHILAEPRTSSAMHIVDFRYAFFGGELPVCNFELTSPLIVHSLESDDDGTWMTDQPAELFQMHYELARFAKGRVLIGGLGLGILARMCELKKTVSSVTVVEKSPDIIKLLTMAGANFGHKIDIICADIFDYVKSLKKDQFDCALLDTWQGTGETAWRTDVVPLRRGIGTKISHVYAWQEKIMLGQVRMGLPSAASCDVKIPCHWYAFRKAVQDAGLKVDTIGAMGSTDIASVFGIESANRSNSDLLTMIVDFTSLVGTERWEKTFGKYWDECLAPNK